ncbi:hypothetical protein MESS2_740021 [Mesorhizobium metallidurans STM 2683]|uniref:Uncharacterized protein n=1 Tax=Mesorhizobium metallidurans STM 2683 TaxID=1297569 RepID=M5ETU8_9HYPH|nr:hypothetical protein MESS2_740021 [Mesorhizobium metallidurans STM 2683]
MRTNSCPVVRSILDTARHSMPSDFAAASALATSRRPMFQPVYMLCSLTMARQILIVLLGVMLLVHAASFSMAAAQAPANSLVASIELRSDGSQVNAPLADRDHRVAPGGGSSQHLSPYHDHCNWVGDTTARQVCRIGNVQALRASAAVASTPASVSVPPPR